MILQICCNLAGSTVFPQLFEALCASGVEQTVFVPEKRQEDVGKNVPRGVQTEYALTVKQLDTIFFFRKAQRSVPKIEKRVDLKNVHLIHAHTLFTDGSIARKLSKKTGIPYMVTLRYSDIEAIWRYMPHLRPMARAILRDAQHVVFLSEAAKAAVMENWLSGKDREEIEKKTAVIPNGIDPEWLDGTPKAAASSPVRVGFAGKYNARKCPLDALEAVHKAGCVWKACGAGPLEDQLREKLGEGDEMVGRVTGMEAMKAFYADCDVLLVPSKAETFGMVYLEAMSQGVPVLYTRGQGFDGQFPEGEIGFSVPCGDTAAQAEALLKIAEDYPARSRRCVEQAARFAWPLVVEKWKALYGA